MMARIYAVEPAEVLLDDCFLNKCSGTCQHQPKEHALSTQLIAILPLSCSLLEDVLLQDPSVWKLTLKSSVLSYCPLLFRKAEKHMVFALKKAGHKIFSASKLTPKFHVIVAACRYVHQIQIKRMAARKPNLEIARVREHKIC
ncbi:uncharacterized protein LOC105161202 [Sesamum indicum]|uniref:Uncharacterized protein LOC105161202 n=1 Tax=Sesamum indicum TaxID=4182 RepID=A0A8M8UPP7_SESIN|nr:uncharacterized protein LOC105161202 [Sesamum indicum]